jgi:hypothetical protein
LTQIGDNEAEPKVNYHYNYLLRGVTVQAYWSAADHAFIVPDGSDQKTYWSPRWSGNTFTGYYDTASIHIDSVAGDSLGNLFALDRSSGAGNIYEHVHGTPWSWTQVGTGFSSLVSDTNGHVFALLSHDHVYQHNDGALWSWQAVGTGYYNDLVSDLRGSVFALSYTVYNLAQQGGSWNWVQVGSGQYTDLVSDATGSVLAANTITGNLDVLAHQGSGFAYNRLLTGFLNSLVSDTNGNVFMGMAFSSWVYQVSNQGTSWGYSLVATSYGLLTTDAAGNVIAFDFNNYTWYKHVDGSVWVPYY